MKISRIIHLRVREFLHDSPKMNGGATVLLDGDDNSAYVSVRVSFCNPADVFCKKLGRESAEKSKEDVIPLRSLPGVLGKLFSEVHKRAHVTPCYRVNYDHKIRDFLPKD